MIAEPPKIPERYDLPEARGRDWFTTSEVCRLAGLQIRHVQKLGERGWCDAIQITPNGMWRFPKQAVADTLMYGDAG